MSNQQDNLDSKVSDAKQGAHNTLRKSLNGKSAVEVAKTRSPKDIMLWIIAFAALIGATLVNYKLPGIWQPANDIWVRVGIIASLIVLAIICLALTNQGRSFKVLLKDASIELRRVTWPSKNETIQYTWQSLLVIGIVAVIVWLLDNLFNWLVGIFIG
ncbi:MULTISPECIES: preprotein translocase subunit SecE [Psychrobacter]|jgi:preprotein translocase subunit SecE|uniref:Protein translocase subunit SecE n=2 Tax=Psychrobacter TaxID=497 RepID=A0A844M202_9GAMM|nr:MULTISPECIES: preprotein translocase subunit SecE [Psychrobacter]MUG32966.1 preprotein translocase subunit SecE [Psychrobacter sanguinis]